MVQLRAKGKEGGSKERATSIMVQVGPEDALGGAWWTLPADISAKRFVSVVSGCSLSGI